MAGAEDMADRSYIRLGHRSENQAIIFLYVPVPHHNQAAACANLVVGENRVPGRPQFVLTF